MKTLTLFFIIAAFVIVLIGLTFMMIGGKLNKKYANKLMLARVGTQAIAIILLFLFFLSK